MVSVDVKHHVYFTSHSDASSASETSSNSQSDQFPTTATSSQQSQRPGTRLSGHGNSQAERPVPNSQRPVPNSQSELFPPVSDQFPTVSGQFPPVSDQFPPVSDQLPTVTASNSHQSLRPVPNSQRSVTSLSDEFQVSVTGRPHQRPAPYSLTNTAFRTVPMLA